jgi:hypothetical protein
MTKQLMQPTETPMTSDLRVTAGAGAVAASPRHRGTTLAAATRYRSGGELRPQADGNALFRGTGLPRAAALVVDIVPPVPGSTPPRPPA